MDVRITQWASNPEKGTTNVTVSITTLITDDIKSKKEYEFSVCGIYDSITEEFNKEVYDKILIIAKSEE